VTKKDRTIDVILKRFEDPDEVTTFDMGATKYAK